MTVLKLVVRILNLISLSSASQEYLLNEATQALHSLIELVP
jgi:hypothetical protein